MSGRTVNAIRVAIVLGILAAFALLLATTKADYTIFVILGVAALVLLGGANATVTRQFTTRKRTFVKTTKPPRRRS
jgi:hypothetical protein